MVVGIFSFLHQSSVKNTSRFRTN